MTQELEIEKGVPIPPHRVGTGRRPHIPFYAMEIGDSVATPHQVRTDYYNKDGKSFLCLKVDEMTWRTWRTA